MTDPRPLRSLLFMPASNARAIAKARTLPCDGVILDLEDSVAPADKGAARAAAVAAVGEGFGDRAVIARANALDTDWGIDDVRALGAAGPDAVLVPKVVCAADVDAAHAALADAPAHVALWIMVESAGAVLNLVEIAARAGETRLAGLVLGPNDLSRELRFPATSGRPALLPILTQAALVARAHGLLLFDGVWNAIRDPDGLAAECAQAVAWGMDGKTLIHPDQVAICNAAFTPDAAAVARARAIVAAFADPAVSGAIRVGDEMVEPLHLAEAQRILAAAARG